MKKLFVFGLAAVLSLAAKADTAFGSVYAYTTLTTAIEAARSQGKMLFIMTGTSTCPHCTDLKDAIAQLASVVNANFVVYYCNAKVDHSMPSAAGYPHWGIYNPYTFDTKKRWSNSGEFYEGLGYGGGTSDLSAVLASAVSQWPNATKTATTDVSGTTTSGTTTRSTKTKESASKLAFWIDVEDLPETLKGNAVLEEFLPTEDRPEAAELTSKLKMAVEKGAKITYSKKKGLVVSDEDGNLSSLKLTYNKNNKTFKGSFKIYTQTSRGALKKITVSIKDGTYKDGVGTATAQVIGTSVKLTVHLMAVAD